MFNLLICLYVNKHKKQSLNLASKSALRFKPEQFLTY